MPAWIRGLVVSLALATVAPAADPALMNLVMPDARMISGFDVEQAKQSPFGQFLLSQLQSVDADLNKFIASTGFDPRRDLQEILLAAPASPRANRALVLVRGSFDPSRIIAMAKLQGVKSSTYKGIEFLSGPQKKNGAPANARGIADGWFGFLDNTIAIMGDPATVRSVIDRRGVGRGPDPKLVAKANQLSGRYHFWGVSMVPVSDFAGQVPDENVSGAMKGDVLRSVLETSGGIHFGSDIEISGEAVTRSEKDATALADVIKFLGGLVQLNQQKDAKVTQAAAILQSLNLQTEGNVMKLSLKIPEADLEKFIEAAKAQQAQARKSARASKSSPPASDPRRNPGDVIIHSSPKEMGTVVIQQK